MSKQIKKDSDSDESESDTVKSNKVTNNNIKKVQADNKHTLPISANVLVESTAPDSDVYKLVISHSITDDFNKEVSHLLKTGLWKLYGNPVIHGSIKKKNLTKCQALISSTLLPK